VLFDTGAPRSVLTLDAARRAGITPTSAGVVSGGEWRGIGPGSGQTWIAPFASFKIGDEEVRNTHLRIGAEQLNGVDMLLGADFFLSHRIYVATGQRKLYFTYNGGPVFDLKTASPPQPPAPQPPAPAAGPH
jgi:predicted aspartyl protease